MILSSNLWSLPGTAGTPALVRVNSEKIIMQGQAVRRDVGDSVNSQQNIDITVGILQRNSKITPATGLYQESAHSSLQFHRAHLFKSHGCCSLFFFSSFVAIFQTLSIWGLSVLSPSSFDIFVCLVCSLPMNSNCVKEKASGGCVDFFLPTPLLFCHYFQPRRGKREKRERD